VRKEYTCLGPPCAYLSQSGEIKLIVKKKRFLTKLVYDKGNTGTTKLRNENETKRNEMKRIEIQRNETKYNETKRKMKKRIETKWSITNRNEIQRNETKRNEVSQNL
jgi:hypothetical protein